MSSRRGKLLTLPGHTPELSALPAGAGLTPGMRLRYRGRLVTVDGDPHCPDEAPTLVDDEGARICLVCGPVGAENPPIRVSPWLPEGQRQRALEELTSGEE